MPNLDPDLVALRRAITTQPAELPPEQRVAIVERAEGRTRGAEGLAEIPGDLVRFVDGTIVEATTVGEEDVRGLLDGGRSEDVVFEAAVAAAVGAGVARMEIVEALLGGRS